MSKYRNKFEASYRGSDTVEKNQYLVGLLSFTVHEQGVDRSFLNKRSRKVNPDCYKVGLNKTRKPRTDVCY